MQGDGREELAQHPLGVAPDGREAAGSSARARLGAVERGGAARDDDGALHRLNELEQGGLARVHGEPHAARGAARVLDDPREGEVVLDRAGEGVRDAVLLGRRADGDDPVRVAHERGEHAQRVIGLP